eukprot:TRINITY_DN4648_c1_g1_i1.p1 TRINITY_DN4648_c1_g1~~TRINITY_DN4648_c1_g1_i1.p1  ORF type:complete len:307 (-),score=61.80 TRINITY_DN4648_c1_g1_i1:187-1107(-)
MEVVGVGDTAPAGAASSERLQSKEQVSHFLDKYSTFLLDCDGVLWCGTTLLPKVCEVLRQLKASGKRVVYLTNNSTKSRAMYLDKFKQFGIDANTEEIVSSSYMSAYYLSSIKFDRKVYVVGEIGVQKELEAVGIQWVGGETHSEYKSMKDLDTEPLDPDVGAVVVGLDTNLNYRKLAMAKFYLDSRKDSVFVSTNQDSTFPGASRKLPGGGTMVAAVETCSGRKAVNVGKPSDTLLELMTSKYSLVKEETVMVGDRLSTDIAFGQRGGFATLLVLTGVTTEEELLSPDNQIRPTYYTNAFGDLLL